ncbi:hypothetical protein MMC25_007786 [Agyrium rufum]|nr:hypothetical protein [Agyrium rufum]
MDFALESRVSLSKDMKPFILILLSKKLASLSRPGSDEILCIISQLLSATPPGTEVDTLTAVVDKLSHPPPGSEHNVMDEASWRHSISGSEGISMWLLDSVQAAPNIWQAAQNSSAEGGLLNRDRPCLLFGTSSSVTQKSENRPSKDMMFEARHVIELPLANTIFETGEVCTAVLQRWTKKSKQDSDISMHMVKVQHLSRATLNLPRSDSSDQIIFVHPTYIDLTEPRVVKDCMGNIIRTFSDSRNPEGGMPASRELELQIPLMREKLTEHDGYEVWARVSKPHSLPELLTEAQSSKHLSSVSDADRYYKVISGGGGWGLKQGLISLDPDWTSWIPHQGKLEPHNSEIETPEYYEVTPLVSPGDLVQFLAVPLIRVKEDSDLTKPRHHRLDSRYLTVSLGSVAAMEDTNWTSSETDDVSSADKISVATGHFGALSERGLGVRTEILRPISEHAEVVHETRLPTGVLYQRARPRSTAGNKE